MSTIDELHGLDEAWVRAEADGDVAALEALAADDFVLVGPAGFVLDKRAWLGRYTGGDLRTRALSFRDPDTRTYARTAVAVGRFVQEAEYRGRPVDGEFRVTRIAVHDGSRWLLGGLHLSPIIAVPPAATPERGR